MTAAFNTDVTLEVSVGFGQDPWETTVTWTDITADVRGLSIQRGSTGGGQNDRVFAGSATVTVSNASGDYTPRNTSGANYPGVTTNVPIRIRATYGVTTYGLFYGMVKAWRVTYPHNVDSVATLECRDALRLFAQQRTSTAESEELSSVRVGNLLDDAGFPAAWRSLDTGVYSVQAYQPQDRPVLSLLHQVADTEGGLFFIDGDGNAVFQAEDYRPAVTSSGTFGVSGTDLRYRSVEYDEHDDQVWNRVVMTPTYQDGEIVGTTAYTAGRVELDATNSQAEHGLRTLTVQDTLHVDAADAFRRASDTLGAYNQPDFGVRRLTVDPRRAEIDTATAWATLLDLELSQLFSVKLTPPGGDAISADVFVESITHTVTVLPEKTWLIDITATGDFDLLVPTSTLFPSSTLFPE